MANPFYVEPPNLNGALQQLMGGIQKAQTNAARRDAAQAFAQGGDQRGALARLLSIGDVQGAQAIAQFGNNERDFAFRQSEAQRSQGNADRSFNLQQQTANNPNIQKDDQGNFVRINKDGSGVTVLPTAGGAGPANPYMTGGKMNEAQSKDALYASRMMNAEQIFRNPEVIQAGSSAWEIGKSRMPFGNFMVSEPYQKFDQAKRDFVNATLRRESGAVISDAEFSNAEKQYFPQPGDSEAVKAQKQKNRMEAIRGIGAGAGHGYRPQKIFDQHGNIVDNPPGRQPQQQGQATTREQYDALPSGATYMAPDGSMRTKR